MCPSSLLCAPGVYGALKVLHLLMAIVFVGDILVSAVFKIAADRSDDPVAAGFVMRTIRLLDNIFIQPSSMLIAITGFLMAGKTGVNVFAHPWMWGSLALLIGTGLLWIAVLVPAQKAMLAAAVDAVGAQATTPGLPQAYRTAARQWNIVGFVAAGMAIAAVVLMVTYSG